MIAILAEQVQGIVRILQQVRDRRHKLSPTLRIGGQSVIMASLIVCGIVGGIVERLGLLEPSELFVYDAVTRLQGGIAPDSRILIVTITEEDLEAHGWPVADNLLAQVLSQLQQHQPQVIGLDIYRNVPHPPGQAALSQQLQADNLIAIYNVGDNPDFEQVGPPRQVPTDQIGFNDLVLDQDGIIRRSLLFVPTEKKEFYSFALRVSLAYLADRDFRYNDEAFYIGNTQFPALAPHAGGYAHVDARGYQVMLNYRNRDRVARQVSFSDVLNNQVDPDWIQDNIVLIGVTAPSLKDLFYTPYSADQHRDITASGVIIHTHMISQILSTVLDGQPLLQFWQPWAEWLWLWSWSLAGGLVVWQLRRPYLLAIAGCVGPVLIMGAGWILFQQAVWVPLMSPLVGFLSTGVIVMAHRLFHNMAHDQLTGLPNRDEFLRRVQRALQPHRGHRSSPPLAVMFLTLDRFKILSESLERRISNRLLQTTVSRLLQVLPPSAQVSRVSSDEFVILLPGHSSETAAHVADQIQQQLSQPLSVNQCDVSTSVSIGIALTQVGYHHQAENLLRDAHTAMYRAKALGKARHEVFAVGMLREVIDRFQMESDIRQGIEQQEFSLHYQPVMSLKTGAIAGFEALARWRHRQRGYISPGAFIPIAEETGLIVPLGEWIFREACRQLYIWQQQFPQEPPLTMSINISGRQVIGTDLTRQLADILEETGVEGRCIKVELTESMVMNDVEAAIDLMLSLKELNLQLGIDDFGTGYSSLSYLHRFPMDTLKVDRSFISRIETGSEDIEIVRAIIALGHNLGMEIVAEGLETESQVQLLRQLNCEYGQGFFFAKPLSTAQAADFLKSPLQR